MLKMRIIPCLDVKDGRVVKGVNFLNLVDAGDPVEAAKAYDAAGGGELLFFSNHAPSPPLPTIATPSSTWWRGPRSNASCRLLSAAGCAPLPTSASYCSVEPTR